MRNDSVVEDFEAEARKADREAQKAPDGSATRLGWLDVATSWRELAQRTIAARTGGQTIH